ncbi:MAG: NADP-dependent malic enzyme [Clostridia bacterium]|nr:NADP-dependent malic enzyme [Clostridia bacterium]
MSINERALKMHEELKGKIEVISRVKVSSREELSLAYTPGVAEACRQIQKDADKSYELTRRWNTVAVITDGTAVLGLGDIGPLAGMPVMEGKCVLFKEFGGVDAIPLCLNTKDSDEIVKTIYNISGSFGGINLEDIGAPRCFEIERRLKELCDIPVFHDDQHGTAIVVLSALINALKITKKDKAEIKTVVAGAGAAGTAITNLLLKYGIKNIIVCDKDGALCQGDPNLSPEHAELAARTNPERIKGSLKDAINGADVFIGVARAGIVTADMIKSMTDKSICFAMSNPVPEIMPEDAEKAGAYIVGTGRSDYKNQINNVIAFPGVFRGALDVRASDINDEMKLAAALAIAQLISEDELSRDYIIPDAFDLRIGSAVSEAVRIAAKQTGVNRI